MTIYRSRSTGQYAEPVIAPSGLSVFVPGPKDRILPWDEFCLEYARTSERRKSERRANRCSGGRRRTDRRRG